MHNIINIFVILEIQNNKMIFWAGLNIMLVIVTSKYHRGATFANESKP